MDLILLLECVGFVLVVVVWCGGESSHYSSLTHIIHKNRGPSLLLSCQITFSAFTFDHIQTHTHTHLSHDKPSDLVGSSPLSSSLKDLACDPLGDFLFVCVCAFV